MLYPSKDNQISTSIEHTLESVDTIYCCTGFYWCTTLSFTALGIAAGLAAVPCAMIPPRP